MLAVEVLSKKEERHGSQSSGNQRPKCPPCTHAEGDFTPNFFDDSNEKKALFGCRGFRGQLDHEFLFHGGGSFSCL